MRTITAGKDNIKLFNSICIETAAVCNRSCVFCPNHTTARPDELMPWSMIEKIAGELASLKYKDRISPYIYNEPMRDKRLPEFIKLFREACPRSNIMMNTNGDYIKHPDDLLSLIELGLNTVAINVYAAKDHTPKGIALAEKRYRELSNMFASTGGSVYRTKGSVNVLRKFGDHFEGGHKKTNRSGNIGWTAPTLNEPLQKGCVRPWRVANINWTGQLILCCNDYHGVTNYGNSSTHTITEMWNSSELHKVRMALQDKDRSTVPLCSMCDFNGGAYQHMIERVVSRARTIHLVR